MKKKLLLIFYLSFYCTYSFAENDSSIIPTVQAYNKNDEKVQIPLLINNSAQEEPKKFEATSTDVRDSGTKTINDNLNTTTSDVKEFNDKDFLDKKTFLRENKKEPSLWQGASLVVGFISLLGILAFAMTKINKKGLFKKEKNDKAMNIVSTISISPKRQVILLQIRDKEIVISNTESGINFISDVGNIGTEKESLIEKKPFQISNFIKSLPNYESTKEKKILETENKSIMNEKKSDILMKALKRIEKEPEAERPSKIEENKVENNDATGKFPKYFSNIFENEAKKEIKKKEEPDSVENVTNLIREKLRSMKPLS